MYLQKDHSILRRILALHNGDSNLATRAFEQQRICAVCTCQDMGYTACASPCVYLWPNSVSHWRSFGAYGDSFAFSQLSHFFFLFGGFRSEQLLNGHSSSETGHWEAQRGLARVSVLPKTHRHTNTHQVEPSSATVRRARCDHLADVFLSPKVTLEVFHTVEFNYNGKTKPATRIIADNKREGFCAQYDKNNTF